MSDQEQWAQILLDGTRRDALPLAALGRVRSSAQPVADTFKRSEPIVIELTLLLDLLAVAGVGFEVEHSMTRQWVLTFDVELTPATAALVEPWRGWLMVIATGRRTGHAPAVCTECGSISMLSIVESTGTRRGLASTPWPRCHITPGCVGQRVVRMADVVGVRRIVHGLDPRLAGAPRGELRRLLDPHDDQTTRIKRGPDDDDAA